MSPEQSELISSTWRQVEPIADDAMRLFYRRLFEIEPGLRPYFAATEMSEQRHRLAQALSAVVDGLEDVGRLLPRLEALGRRHVEYGATAKHYDAVGAALLWTLRRGLGDAWNEAAESAWRIAYELVSNTMQGAAEEQPRKPAGEAGGLAAVDRRPALAN